MKRSHCLLSPRLFAFLLMLFSVIVFSCSNNYSNDYTETENIAGSGEKNTHSIKQSTYSSDGSSNVTKNSASEQNTYSSEKENKTVGNEISRICNTKWTFTDSHGTSFVLKINGIARDGESAKAEFTAYGETFYVTVEAKYHGHGGEKKFERYDVNADYYGEPYIYFPSSKDKYDSGCLANLCWDYDNGYLYKTMSLFDSESPVDRLSIKKAK